MSEPIISAVETVLDNGKFGQRRRLLNYLQKTEIERYRSIVERLGLRR